MAEPLISREQAEVGARAGERSLACTCAGQAALAEVLAALQAEGVMTRATITPTADGQLFLLAYRMSEEPFDWELQPEVA